jgi:hypothetical protein
MYLFLQLCLDCGQWTYASVDTDRSIAPVSLAILADETSNDEGPASLGRHLHVLNKGRPKSRFFCGHPGVRLRTESLVAVTKITSKTVSLNQSQPLGQTSVQE